jgi:uncharacterized flavoprotein (TIGR03862 family)
MGDARIAVIGGGPAGLMAAEGLAAGGGVVTLFERMPSVGRKFLLAGRGGLNLTHSEAFEQMMARFGAAAPALRPAIEAFPPPALRDWCEALGQETFVGSSGRVFPKAMKSSPLLRAWLVRLRASGVEFRMRHRWTGWSENGELKFDTPEGEVRTPADAVVLALGGASWPKLGSTGEWQEILRAAGIGIAPLTPANCGFVAGWTKLFAERFQGQPLKGIELGFANERVRGELVVTQSGLEGGAIYALAPQLRTAIAQTGEAALLIDLRPDVAEDALAAQLGAARGKQSLSSFLRKAARLSPVAIGLLHEAAMAAGRRLTDATPQEVAATIKRLPVKLTGVAPIERAISTAGGISFDEVDEHFMLKRKPGVFVAGEMLDWEAPTGGYLLQACFATGRAAGQGALNWLKERAR